MNLLGLPCLELKNLYSAHLYLVEFGLPTEVSLHVLSLRFFHNKKMAVDAYHRELENEVQLSIETLEMLELLEDREIDGVVLCMIGHCYLYKRSARKKMETCFQKAFRILNTREETSLSSMELFYKAFIYERGPCIEEKKRPSHEIHTEIERLYLLSMTQSIVYRPVFHTLAGFTRDCVQAGKMDMIVSRWVDVREKMLSYYSRGSELGCPLSMLRYALMLINSLNVDERCLARMLCRRAADMGYNNAMYYMTMPVFQTDIESLLER